MQYHKIKLECPQCPFLLLLETKRFVEGSLEDVSLDLSDETVKLTSNDLYNAWLLKISTGIFEDADIVKWYRK